MSRFHCIDIHTRTHIDRNRIHVAKSVKRDVPLEVGKTALGKRRAEREREKNKKRRKERGNSIESLCGWRAYRA